ncbi:MAG: hypothetical protein HZB36_07410 [Candidatus Omnitrophica bacterium]|nr:hypothetical protein [Candidatus Omnitrophota bacterium]
MLKFLTQKEKIILSVAAGLITAGIVFNFLIIPTLTENARLNGEIRITRGKFLRYTKLLASKRDIQEKYEKFYASFKMSRIEQDALAGILSEFEDLAGASGVHIVDIRPDMAEKDPGKVKGITVELRVKGTSDAYMKFIYAIENSLSLLRIKKFQLNAKPNSQTLEGVFSILQLSPLE